MAEQVYQFEKNRTQSVVASVSEYRGSKRIDIRIWFRDDDDKLQPTRQGVSVPVERFHEVKKMVLALEEYLTEKGILEPEKESPGGGSDIDSPY